MSADPARRLSAGQAVFKSRDAAALPTLESALAKETDASVRTEFADARAVILAAKIDAPERDRLAAIATLRARADQDARTALASVSAAAQGLAQQQVKAAADEAIRAIDSRLALWSHAQNVWYGLSLGSVLLLAAIGLAITFGVMGVINMAHASC